jgi:hypothetical protein
MIEFRSFHRIFITQFLNIPDQLIDSVVLNIVQSCDFVVGNIVLLLNNKAYEYIP